MFIIFLLSTLTSIREETLKFDENISSAEQLRDLGVVVYKKVLSEDEIDRLKLQCSQGQYRDMKDLLFEHTRLRELITDATGDSSYILQDYLWIIEKSSVHTCHRDNNGDFFNGGQKHPSYTMIVYLEDMYKCLLVIPSSHENIHSHSINLGNSTRNILCKRGDVIIFNANLIHAGTLTEKENNRRIQMKVTHRDDIAAIAYYEDYHKVLNKENTNPKYIRKVQQNLSCLFPGIANTTQRENIRTARGSQEGVEIGYLQKLFSYLFYGSRDYYDLPNAF